MFNNKLGLIALLCLAVACATSAAAQATAPDLQADTTTTSPIAYIYVAYTPKDSSTNEVNAYAAASDGTLKLVPGSPFRENVSSMASNGKYLMAVDRTKPVIDSYLIESDGALTYKTETNYAIYNNGSANECGSAGQIYFDHTGATLYVQEFDGTSACTNDVVGSFNVVKSSGALTYLGTANTGAFPGDYTAAYFIGDNIYAYTADDSACMYYEIYGFKRASNGNLSLFSAKYNQPTPPAGVRGYIPNLSAADPTNHLAFIMQPANPPGCASGPLQMASYTANSDGSLTTTNTAANMPDTKIVNFNDLKMAPSGKLLAVAGQEGLQIFHFNGASPITKYTGLLTTAPINQMYWDNGNHLYAISQTTGRLFVFTITPTGYAQAPGSPYAINSPDALYVQPTPVY